MTNATLEKYKEIPYTVSDDYKSRINNTFKAKKLEPWKYTPTLCKQLRQTYMDQNYYQECIQLPEDKNNKNQKKTNPSENKNKSK